MKTLNKTYISSFLISFFMLLVVSGCGNNTAILKNVAADTSTAETTTVETATVEITTVETTAQPTTEETTTINPNQNYLIAIDAGHQAVGNNDREPIGPGATETKIKVAGGTSGVASGLAEYELTLSVALKLRDILEEEGFSVLMIRESNDVDISNSQRAIMANEANADVFIRIHADGSDSASANGMTALCQTASNPYNGNLYEESYSLSECVLNAMVKETGARSRGITTTDTMSGINWASVPTTIIEMGFMTNPEEDLLMASDEYQEKLARGMAVGIHNYLELR